MNKKLNKKWLFSLFSVPLVALPIGLSTMNNSTNSVSLVSKSLNINESPTDTSINWTDALPVSDESIKSFGDYIVSYEDNNISPVNVVVPNGSESTDDSKAGGATVGMTKSKQTITLTTYAGLLLWSHKLVDNQLLKQYYSSVKSISDISNYKVINFAYLESKSILFVLFGEETTADTTTLSNLVVFGLDINSGSIVVPSTGKLAESQVIAQARDNSAFIFFNSSDQLLITSGDQPTDIASSSKIMSFDENAGFANVKGNDEESNAFGNVNTSETGIASINDYLLGFLPSSVKGVNYSIWLYSNSAKGQSVNLSYTTGNDNQPNKTLSLANHFNYYVIPLKDDFTKIGINGTNFDVVNKNSGGSTARGYLTGNSNSSSIIYDDIYKRFFITESTNDNNTVTESIGLLLDSVDAMFSSFENYSLTISNANADNHTNADIKYKSSNVFMNYDANSSAGPKTTSDLESLPKGVSVSSWDYNSVGYDKESNFVYFSLSGEELNDSSSVEGTLTNTRYIDLKPENVTNAVSIDKYVEAKPYTLSDVNFDTYTNEENLYLTKQTIDGDSGEWLSTTVNDLNNDDIDFKKTGDISFNSLENLVNELQNSEVLEKIMPSVVKDNLSSLELSEESEKYIKFTGASGNDETGEINLQTEITYPNNFGNNENDDDGSVSYTTSVQVIGFTINDFELTFKQNTDSAVEALKKYSAEQIVKTNNKGWVIQNLINNLTLKGSIYNFENWPIPEDAVELSNDSNTNDLKVTINVPIKKSLSDNGVLPIGFSADKSTVSFTYTGFTGDETPPLVNYPYNPLPSNPGDGDSNNGNNSNGGLSGGAIAGIVIGCLALAAIIIAVIVLVRIRSKSKIAA